MAAMVDSHAAGSILFAQLAARDPGGPLDAGRADGVELGLLPSGVLLHGVLRQRERVLRVPDEPPGLPRGAAPLLLDELHHPIEILRDVRRDGLAGARGAVKTRVEDAAHGAARDRRRGGGGARNRVRGATRNTVRRDP